MVPSQIDDVSKNSHVRKLINSFSEDSDSAITELQSIDRFAHVERTVDNFDSLDVMRSFLIVVGACHIDDQTQSASL